MPDARATGLAGRASLCAARARRRADPGRTSSRAPVEKNSERGRIVEVGFLARMLQRVVRAPARAILDDGCQADAPRPWCIGEHAELYGSRHTQLARALGHLNRGRRRELERSHPLPVAIESVRGPSRRRRNVDLAIARAGRGRDERLEARVLPEPLGTPRARAARDRELREIACEHIFELE